MFAVVDIAGQQFKVQESKKYYVPQIDAVPDTELEFDSVLLFADENGSKIGTPALSGAKVTAKVLGHVQDDKVVVFKKKRRTGYKKTHGHRQQLTQIEIMKIA